MVNDDLWDSVGVTSYDCIETDDLTQIASRYILTASAQNSATAVSARTVLPSDCHRITGVSWVYSEGNVWDVCKMSRLPL